MSLIKPRTRGKHWVRHLTRLDHQNEDTLYAYAAFINEDAEYVLNQLVDMVLARDRDFLAWRADHPESFVPQSKRRAHRRRTPTIAGAALVGTAIDRSAVTGR